MYLRKEAGLEWPFVRKDNSPVKTQLRTHATKTLQEEAVKSIAIKSPLEQ